MRTAAWIAVGILIATLARADVPRGTALPAHELRLPNGMTVVLAPDPTVTSVVVHVRYGDGAATESHAQAGFTRLVEQLFAAGTVHTKAGEHQTRIETVGGWTTSTTTLDHLSLVTQVPAGALELVLWLEAERMAGLADGITDAGFATARTASVAAYRAAYVDQPYALVARAVRDALWPAGHPNRNDVLGDGGALDKATLAEVRAFIRQRIRPSAARLVITGQFDVARTGGLVRRYFGWIPSKPAATVPQAKVEPLATPSDVRITDSMRKVVVAYRIPAGSGTDMIAFDVAAHVLAGSPTARLQRALVDTKRATEVRAEVMRQHHGSELQLHVTPTATADLERIAALVRAEVATFAVAPPSKRDVERARAAIELGRMITLESLAARAHAYASARAGTPLADYARSIRDEIATVTPQTLHELAKTWLAELRAVTVISREAKP